MTYEYIENTVISKFIFLTPLGRKSQKMAVKLILATVYGLSRRDGREVQDWLTKYQQDVFTTYTDGLSRTDEVKSYD